MSTDAWIEEHWIGEAVLLRPRRAPKLPALPVPHAPTCSRGNAALAAHAQSRDSARHPGDRLSVRQDGRNVVDQQARKLTQPFRVALGPPPQSSPNPANYAGGSRWWRWRRRGRVDGVPDAEEKPQKEQRHQIAERFGHNTFTGEFSTPRVDGKARALTATHWQIFILLYQNRGDVVSNDRIRAELAEGSIT